MQGDTWDQRAAQAALWEQRRAASARRGDVYEIPDLTHLRHLQPGYNIAHNISGTPGRGRWEVRAGGALRWRDDPIFTTIPRYKQARPRRAAPAAVLRRGART